MLSALLDEPGVDPAWQRRAAARAQRARQRLDEDDRCDLAPRRGQSLAPLLAHRNGTRTHAITAVGHAHIDTAWLWPLEETYRKCVRTFATQLRADGALPRLPLRVLAGPAVRLDPRRTRRACGSASASASPRAAGCRSAARGSSRTATCPRASRWCASSCSASASSSRARPPRDGVLEPRRVRLQRPAPADHARGRDGPASSPRSSPGTATTRPSTTPSAGRASTAPTVLAHFPPADTYNAEATVDRAAPLRARLQGPRPLGAEPAAVRLGRRRRRADARHARDDRARGRPAGRAAHRDRPTPRRSSARSRRRRTTGRRSSASCTSSTTAAPTRARRAPSGRAAAPSGCCTTRSCSPPLADRLGAAPWPGEPLDGAWRTLLLNHFHDIIPGSSIGEVHARAERDLAAVGEAAAGAARCARSPRSAAGSGTRPASRAREVVATAAGLRLAEAPPCGTAALVEPRDAVTVEEHGDGFVLANGQLRAVLGRDGTLRSLVHRASGREALTAPGNVLELYEDRPTDFEAWDIDPFHLETRQRLPARDARRGRLAPTRCAPSSPFERPIGRAQPDAPGRPARRRGRAARVPLHGRLARGAARAEGPLPGRRARAARHLRDAVRRGRAPDAPLDAPRRRPVRGPRPPLRRPLRARLRRGAALRRHLRLVGRSATRCG